MLSSMLKKIFHKFISGATRGLSGISGPSRATTRNDLIESNPSDALETLKKIIDYFTCESRETEILGSPRH